MEDKPKFMSGRWQWKLLREQPIAFSLLTLTLAIPVLFVVRTGLDGGFGPIVQSALRIVAACLLLGLFWLVFSERKRWKERNRYIDAYLEKRYEQMHERRPPES